MAEAGSGGHPVQILEVNGGKLRLNGSALGLILHADHVRDKPVVVVSVAGTFRKGKSFLLNFFLRYLRNLGRDDVDWLGEPGAPLRGFAWHNGSERHTTGILVWSEVFLVTTSEGHELAVVLMDTQGTFDCETTTKVYSAIFALTTMVSSVLIYNVSQNIQEDHLQHLQLFAEYGQLVLEEANKEPFQKLLFLVRDWACPYEATYGAEGGQKLLEKRLRMTEVQGADLRLLRQRILSCFSTIGCFLMPYPGTKVATSEFFDGRLSDIDECFKTQLRHLVRLVLAPNNLLVKQVNGRNITCRDLMAYFQAYVREFKDGRVPQPRSVYEATLKASNLAAMDRAREFYTTEIMKAWESRDSKDRARMESHHTRLFEEAKRIFEAIPKMGGQEFSRRYKRKMTEQIRKTFHDLTKDIGKKPIVETVQFLAAHGAITTGIAGAAVSLAVVELPVVAAVCGAIGVASLTGWIYNVARAHMRKQKRLTEGNEALLDAYDEDSDSSLISIPWERETTESAQNEPGSAAGFHLATSSTTEEVEAFAEAANRFALNRAKQMYNVSMEELCDDASSSLSPHLLESHHYRLREAAQELFSDTCREAGVRVLPDFMEKLRKEIDELFENIVNQTRSTRHTGHAS